MAETAKAAQHELELELHRHSADVGVQAARNLLHLKRDALNARWMDASGEELLQKQGEAKAVRWLLKMIEDGPTIKA